MKASTLYNTVSGAYLFENIDGNGRVSHTHIC